jgi:hypothetical protein
MMVEDVDTSVLVGINGLSRKPAHETIPITLSNAHLGSMLL